MSKRVHAIAGCAAALLALSNGLAGSTGAQRADGRSSPTYLKRSGDVWLEVRKDTGGLQVMGAADAPLRPGAPRVASGLFHPYVAYSTGSWPEAVGIGDVTGDGLNDVVMVTSFYFDDANDFKLFVFKQLPNGALAGPVKLATMATYTNRPESVAVGDVNGDGRNDVVIGNGGAAIGVFTQDASGGLNPVVLYPTVDSKCVRIADLNNDGRNDVVGLGWGTNTVSVLLQKADGTLQAPAVYSAPHSGYDDLEVGDLNHDGLTDVVVMSGQLYATPNISVLYQQVDGTLGGLTSRFVGTNELTQGIGVGDLTADALTDIVASYGGNSPSSRLALFSQQPDGSLAVLPSTVPSYDIPEPVEVADVDGDGRADVIVAHGGWNALGVYRQGPTGGLGAEALEPIPYASHYNPHGLAVGDINNDGAPDVALADYNNGLVVLRHVPGAQRYYTVTPCRILDTRTTWPLQAGEERPFAVVGSCGLPAEARAVALNITAVNPGDLGDLRLYPAGGTVPTASTINFSAGKTRANNAVLRLGASGLAVRCDMPPGSTASVHLVVDVYGYFR